MKFNFYIDIDFEKYTFLKGFINLIALTFILYFINCYKHGVNVLVLLFSKSKLIDIVKNDEIIINEDSDVSDERARIKNTNLNVI